MVLQTSVYSIIIITITMAILLLFINKKLNQYNPLEKPKGIVLLVLMFAQMIDKMVKEKTNERVAKYLTPYIMSVASYIFLSNISGLFSLGGLLECLYLCRQNKRYLSQVHLIFNLYASHMHLIFISDSPPRQPVGNEYPSSIAVQLPFGCCSVVVQLLSSD